MEQQKRRKLWLITAIVAAVLVIAAVAVGVSYAVWKNTGTALDTTDTPTGKWNPSLKSQVFALLDAGGNPMGGSVAIADAAAVAFVGCAGLLETELTIPDTATIAEADGTGKATLNVTKVLVLRDQNAGDIRLFQDGKPYTYTQSIVLRNNLSVTDLIIPQNVVFVASGMFSFMQALESIVFEGTETIEIRDRAFTDCRRLNALSLLRPLSLNSNYAEIFKNTPLGSP